MRDPGPAGRGVSQPAILAVTWIAIVIPLVAIVVALAFAIAYLVTGSAGLSYPAPPAAESTRGGA